MHLAPSRRSLAPDPDPAHNAAMGRIRGRRWRRSRVARVALFALTWSAVTAAVSLGCNGGSFVLGGDATADPDVDATLNFGLEAGESDAFAIDGPDAGAGSGPLFLVPDLGDCSGETAKTIPGLECGTCGQRSAYALCEELVFSRCACDLPPGYVLVDGGPPDARSQDAGSDAAALETGVEEAGENATREGGDAADARTDEGGR